MPNLSDDEQILARGDVNCAPLFNRMVDHDEVDEMEEDRDREVLVVESDATDAGEELNGVVDVLGSSRIVSAGRIRDLMGMPQPCGLGGGQRSRFAFIRDCRRILPSASNDAEQRSDGLL